MARLIDFESYPINQVLKALIKDKTTRKNVIFATDVYCEYDSGINEKSQITEHFLKHFGNDVVQPRVSKSQEEQAERTKKKAEVFTPSWICNKMNNHCDAEWFGRENVFNIENNDNSWSVVEDKISFPENKNWKQYVDSNRLEITCGEAPYIVSRYDAATGELIPVQNRIGILDRKLRIVNENTDSEKDWFTWVIRAYQSVYGYEFQGDNLLIARINLLNTFVDYMQDRWNRIPTDEELKKITNIIVWNLWQMDGITGLVPFGEPKEEYHQVSLFDFVIGEEEKKQDDTEVECKIYDWRRDNSIRFNMLKEG